MNDVTMYELTWTRATDYGACWGPLDDPDVVVRLNVDPRDIKRQFSEYYSPAGAIRVHRAHSRSNWVRLDVVPDIPAMWDFTYALVWDGQTDEELRPVDPNSFDPPGLPFQSIWHNHRHRPHMQLMNGDVLGQQAKTMSATGFAERVGAGVFIRFDVFGPWHNTHETLTWDEEAKT